MLRYNKITDVMKKLLIFSLAVVVILSGCQNVVQPSTTSGESIPLATKTSIVLPTVIPEVNPTTLSYPLGERFKIKNYYLNTPQNWFYTVVNQENMLGWVFTPNDPLLMAEQGFNNWSAIVWLVTPIPQGSDVEEMHKQMLANVGTYTSDELQAVLLPAQETGLIEITDEPVTLNKSEVVKWGNVDALHLQGNILFSDSSTTQIDVDIYLTWNADEFISFYQFSDHVLTETLNSAFLVSRESIEMP